jgi:hypothetical protein
VDKEFKAGQAESRKTINYCCHADPAHAGQGDNFDSICAIGG